MFRVKIVGMLALIIILLMVVVYISLPAIVEGTLRESVTEELVLSATSIERAQRLNDYALIAKAEQIAAFDKLQEALTAEYEGKATYQRHIAVHDKGLLRWKFVFENAARDYANVHPLDVPHTKRPPFFPELVFITDESGVGVAALGKGKYDWYDVNVAETQPSILSEAVLKGSTVTDVWNWAWSEGDQPVMAQVAIAPIRSDGRTLGMVVVGNPITSGTTAQESDALDGLPPAKDGPKRHPHLDISHFYKGRIFASTLPPEDQGTLATALFGDPNTLGDSATPDPVEVEINGQTWLAAVRYSRGVPDRDARRAGVVVVVNLDQRYAAVSKLRTGIPVFGLILLIAAIGVVLVGFSSVTKPLEQLDQGVQEIIAGNKDYVFQIQGGYAFQQALAHSLNLMSAYLQGKPMPDEDDDDAWKDFLVDEVTETSIMRAVQGKPTVQGLDLSAYSFEDDTDAVPEDDEEAYRQRLYNDYVTAKKNLGEDVSEITYEGFTGRLDKNIAKLKVAHKARDIKFDVVVRDGRVVLKPQPIM